MNNFITHIPFGRLVDLAEGRLPAGERLQLEAHISSCPRCANEAAELELLIALMRSDTAVDAPHSLTNRAVDLFLNRVPPAFVPEPGLQSILATLRFDSLGMAPAFGVRSGEPSARQLLYSTDAHDIDLRIEPAEGGWVLSGQMLGETTAGRRVELEGGLNVIHTNLTELSEFTFPPVTADVYRLYFFLSKFTVEIVDLRIGS